MVSNAILILSLIFARHTNFDQLKYDSKLYTSLILKTTLSTSRPQSASHDEHFPKH
jgi:hypothetical protein